MTEEVEDMGLRGKKMQLKEDFDHWLHGREDEEQQGQDVKDISYRLQLSSTFSAALLYCSSAAPSCYTQLPC